MDKVTAHSPPTPCSGSWYHTVEAMKNNNGRIAMFSAVGQIAAGLYTGKAGLEQFGV